MTISIWKKLNFYILLSQQIECQLLQCHFFCHLLESSLARINWIRAVCQFRVEQLISCQKCRAIACRAIACRAIAIRAVHPHSIEPHTAWASKKRNKTIEAFLLLFFYYFHFSNDRLTTRDLKLKKTFHWNASDGIKLVLITEVIIQAL